MSSPSYPLGQNAASSFDNSNLQLLHVIEDTIPSAYSLVGKSSIYSLFPDLENKTKERLENLFSETNQPKIKHENYIVNGHAAKDILNFAKSHNSNLIVIATHGLTGIEHLLIGSVAEKVVRMAQCPVFITKSFGKKIITDKNEQRLKE